MTDILTGFGYSPNGVNPSSLIDVGQGICSDSLAARTINLPTSMTKDVTASFAAGDGNGALDTGAIASAYYWIHVILSPATGAVDVLVSLSLNNPVMPAGFTARRMIGGFCYAGGIWDFVSVGDWHYYKTRITSVSGAMNGTTATPRLLAVPVGAKAEVQAYLQASSAAGANAGWVTVRDPDLGPYVVGVGEQADWFYGVGQFLITRTFLRTNTAARVSSADNNATDGRITIAVEGWRVDRSVYR